jgi:hypothetical protein
MGAERLEEMDWECSSKALLDDGFAELPQVLTRRECEDLRALYTQADLFRSHIDMTRYRFGKGEYQYFRYPLPPLVEELRRELYPRLVKTANLWAERLGMEDRFPATFKGLLRVCEDKGQSRPTPLLLRYHTGDYNCLHQDIYGEIAFPFQLVFFLSEPEREYAGGQFLLVENAPRAQAMGRAFTPRQGDAMAITTRYRPAQGKRGYYKIAVRHGVSPLKSGERWTLGIIFHDAE